MNDQTNGYKYYYSSSTTATTTWCHRQRASDWLRFWSLRASVHCLQKLLLYWWEWTEHRQMKALYGRNGDVWGHCWQTCQTGGGQSLSVLDSFDDWTKDDSFCSVFIAVNNLLEAERNSGLSIGESKKKKKVGVFLLNPFNILDKPKVTVIYRITVNKSANNILLHTFTYVLLENLE